MSSTRVLNLTWGEKWDKQYVQKIIAIEMIFETYCGLKKTLLVVHFQLKR